MRYIIDQLDIPQKIKDYYEKRPRDYKECVHAFSYAFVCKHCGTEVYGEFKYEPWYVRNGFISSIKDKKGYASSSYERALIDKEIKETEEELKALEEAAEERYRTSIEAAGCPICGAKLQQERGYFFPASRIYSSKYKNGWDWQKQCKELYGSYLGDHSYQDMDYEFRRLSKIRNKMNLETANTLLNTQIQACDVFVPGGFSPKASEIKRNSELLKAYILNLIHLENNIYSLQQLLPDLYLRRLENEPAIVFEECSPAYNARAELNELREACKEALEDLCSVKEYQPVVEIEYPAEPSAPVLKKPGLFNKQKVLAENEMLTKQYQVEMAAYQQEVRRCDAEKDRLIKQKKNAALQKAVKKATEAKAAYEAAQASLDAKLISLKGGTTPAKVAKSLLDQEIASTEELLKKTYAARNELYAYDIVFEKYRNPVALSSFYEYLASGRCASLEGAEGAYNIYESEIRANRVIAQLDTVVSSLESIKENQYMMYRQMQYTNSQLKTLNDTMDKALTSIQGIEANTTRVAENSDVIAHNTAVSAYYSKVNAELTNALGFMVAYNS